MRAVQCTVPCSLVVRALFAIVVDAPSVLGRSGIEGTAVAAGVVVVVAAVEVAAEAASDAPALSHGFGGDGIVAARRGQWR